MLAAVYANAYGRANVTDHLCSCSFAAIDRLGQPKAPSPALASQLFGWSNGLTFISPHGITDVIDDRPVPDFNFGPALCFRSLATGASYPGQNPAGTRRIDTSRIEAGISEVRATGNLQGKPALILHGRSDALIPPNHTSRAYFGLNKIVEGAASRLSYIEIVNANHFDGFISIFGKKRLVPIHYYLDQALSKMRGHLLDPVAHPLPGSQVVTARADNKPWKRAMSPTKRICRISRSSPHAAQRIEFRDATVEIPDGC